ncbi:MAG: hypothetical protein J6Q82_03145 [Clostridia bacterium]|nr:hypothetical protein [Clostridia bacterium]
MNQAPQSTDSIGYLQVKVTTARGAIPLADATVILRGNTPETSGVMLSLRTDRDGKTERISLPTPPISESETPNGATPFAVYNVDVSKEGYLPLSIENIPIFPSILSIQPAVMLPAPPMFGDFIGEFPSTVVPEPPSADL